MTTLDAVPDDQKWVLRSHLPHPVEEVYEAFMDPQALVAWYGPHGWQVDAESVTIEPVPDGARRMLIRLVEDPQQAAPIHARHGQVRVHELIEVLENLPGPDGRPSEHIVALSVAFEATEGHSPQEAAGTRLILTQGPLPAEVHGTARTAWEESLQRLRALLGSRA